MKPNTRSASGAILMLVIIPVIVGLLACMPVPIGDPERSRIDPNITGIWAVIDGDDDAFFVFEPYDKRTWLATFVPIEEGNEADLDDLELESHSDPAELIDKEPVVGSNGVTAGKISNFKAWRTKLGGEWFMTLEPKMVIDNEDFAPEVWWVFRIDRPDENTVDLIALGDDLFRDVDKTRRAYERIIKKNAKNEDLYSDDVTRMVRVKSERLGFFRSLVSEAINTN